MIGTATDASTGILNVTVDGIGATTSDLYTNWSANVTGLVGGTNTLVVIAADNDLPSNTATNTVRVIYADGVFDGDGNGMADACELQYFGTLGVDPADDPDGDG